MAVIEAPRKSGDGSGSETVQQLVDLSGPAYRLAVSTLGSSEGAQDVVQQAYLEAVARLRAGTPPREPRAWFLTIVAYIARNHIRGESRRRRREGLMVSNGAPTSYSAREDEGLSRTLQAALLALESEYRVVVALCCQEGLTRREAAEILALPERTVSKHVEVGLDRLRRALAQEGYAAIAPAAILAALSQAAPAIPAGLAATAQRILTSGALPIAKASAAVAAGVSARLTAPKALGLPLGWKIAAVASATIFAGGAVVVFRSSPPAVQAASVPEPAKLLPAPEAPAPIPAADLAASNLREIDEDMTLPGEGVPHGIAGFSWEKEPFVKIGNDVAARLPGWNAMTPTGMLYRDSSDSPDTNTRVEFSPITLCMLTRSGKWVRLQQIQGRGYFGTEDQRGAHIAADLRTEPNGNLSVKLKHGYMFRFYPAVRTEFDPGDLAGWYVTYRSRLIPDDPGRPDDRDRARYLASAGGSYNLRVTGDAPEANVVRGVAGGRFKYVRSEWRAFNMSTVSLEQLKAHPPPGADSAADQELF